MTTSRTARPRRPLAPSLPRLTIARSPANDARVIVDAFLSTPALVRLLTDRAGLVHEHRAELRELLQQVTNWLGAAIDRTAEVRRAAADPGTPADRVAVPDEAPARNDPPTPARAAERSSTRRRSPRGAPATPPTTQSVAPWDGRGLLR